MHTPCLILIALLILLINSASCFSPNFRASRLGLQKNHHPSAIFSTIDALPTSQLIECQGCNATFTSRNALFRHLRGEDEASASCSLSIATSEEELLMTAVIRYGYYYDGDTSMEGGDGANEVVANIVYKAFEHQMNKFLEGEDHTNDEGNVFSSSALTYSSAAKMRQPSLGQDKEVICATAEVMSFNYILVNTPLVTKRWEEHASGGELQQNIQSWLDDESNNCQVQVELHMMDALVPRSSKFYAERSATQYCYRYMLPVTWVLPDAEEKRAEEISKAVEWWSYIRQRGLARKHEPRSSGNTPECPTFIQRMKQALKSLESETVENRRMRRQAQRNINDDDASDAASKQIIAHDSTTTRLSPGRFGQLWRKQKRCWSNFASGSGMMVSPGFEAVWKTIDRAKIVGFINLQNESESGKSESLNDTLQNMHIVIEFRADGFVMGQIPRVISALVGITNGWLPQNFFAISTRPDMYMPVSTIPPCLDRRLYFHSARYHFHELTSNGNGMGDDSDGAFVRTINSDSQSEEGWEIKLREKLLGRDSLSESSTSKMDKDWLLELRDVVSPDLRQQIEKAETETLAEQTHADEEAPAFLPKVDTDAPPGAFSTTLELLRGVVENGKWPATSDARSRVIKSPARSKSNLVTKKRATISQFPRNEDDSILSGSFTVVNSLIWGGDQPLANDLFPELTKSVFELEEEIIRQTKSPLPAADGMKRSSSQRRSPSTHCAVNRNAQFAPHVDSGRGKGQTTSLIVGLGNYTGGETIVEGKQYNIRYKALEFDGWNQLHWTSTFKGERYSLVWFTPEISPKESSPGDKNYHTIFDDEQAQRLAQQHSRAVPFLPPLRFRYDSTDALVIQEILNSEGSVYSMKSTSKMPSGFSVKGHKCVLDIGAHIGVFSRYALEQGCQKVIAYEPEPNNVELLSQNLEIIQHSKPQHALIPDIELHSAAVAHESSETRILIRARHENDGKENTWRHSLEEYSQYVDRETKLSSTKQMNILERFEVACISFLNGALVPGVTFVKLDCEGAEIDILLSSNASKQSSWLDVTHLVLEWSFTKERRVSVFHKAMDNLRTAGFEIYYDGKGSWWDSEGVLWPYPNDLIVFAKK